MATVARIQERCHAVGLTVTVQAGDSRFRPLEDAEAAPFSARTHRQCLAPWSVPYLDRAGRVFPVFASPPTARSWVARRGTAGRDLAWRALRRVPHCARRGHEPAVRLPRVHRRDADRPASAALRRPDRSRRPAGPRPAHRRAQHRARPVEPPLATRRRIAGRRRVRPASAELGGDDRIQYMRDDQVPPGGTMRFEFRSPVPRRRSARRSRSSSRA
jgi:hypothetical protein